MDLAEIETTLANAENIPVIGGIVRDLQRAVEILKQVPLDANIMTTQANDLDQLARRGASLFNEYHTS